MELHEQKISQFINKNYEITQNFGSCISGEFYTVKDLNTKEKYCIN